MTWSPTSIHQFSYWVASGDGVTNSLLFIRKLLRNLGYQSDIYAGCIPNDLEHEVYLLDHYIDQPDQILLVHHSIGHDQEQWLMHRSAFKILVYHNITPADYFPPHSELFHYCSLGRKQLQSWASSFPGAIGLSEYNTEELKKCGYRTIGTIPLLVEVGRVTHADWDPHIPKRYSETYNVLFVGRIVPHKCQHDLVELVEMLSVMGQYPVCLLLVGGVASEDYHDRLQKRVQNSPLRDSIVMTGQVSDKELFGYYRAADVFVSMSEHEGFGIPLIEAMQHDIPVVAYGGSNIAHTIGTGGLCFSSKTIPAMAAAVHLLHEEPLLKRRVIQGQQHNLRRFTVPVLIEQLRHFLSKLGIALRTYEGSDYRPTQEKPLFATDLITIEGPFDSSYSLAIVNREMARALHDQGLNVVLRSTEGEGDFDPNPLFLARDTDSASLYCNNEKPAYSHVVLRNLYPPRVDGMYGTTHVLHSFAWEESAFPLSWVKEFNRHLHLITTTSHFVAKVLEDHGVRVPITVTGNGVDHLLKIRPKPFSYSLGKAFRFLHISSCFPRKGVDVLLRAYARAFKETDEVTLVIKTFPNPHNDVEWHIAQLRHTYPQCPDILLINTDIEEGHIVELYQSCHALVAPSRGEGFNLTVAEAMLFALPVIVTGYSGTMDFCNHENAWLINYQFTQANSHLNLPYSVWAEPDECHLVKLLQEVYVTSIDNREVRTKRAQSNILKEYTWDCVAHRLRSSLHTLEEYPPFADKALRVGWVTPWHCRCGIASYSRWLTSSIPSSQLILLANDNAEFLPEESNIQVIHCWQAGHGDTLEKLFHTICEQQLRVVVIQFNFGFFHLDYLSQLVVRLRKMGILCYIFFHSTADVNSPDFNASIKNYVTELRYAERLYVHTIADLNRFKSFGLIENVVLFPHGVYQPPKANRGILRQKMGLEGHRVLACHGYLLPHKGIPQLIEAFIRLQNEDGDFHLLLINALYPINESIVEQSTCLNLIEQSRYRSNITVINDYLSEEDALVCLSLSDLIVYPYQHTQESTSGAVRMGLASLVPVACTPLGIFDDVAKVVHRLPGTTVDDLVSGIKAFFSSSAELKKDLSTQQHAYVEAHQWTVLSERIWNSLNTFHVNH